MRNPSRATPPEPAPHPLIPGPGNPLDALLRQAIQKAADPDVRAWLSALAGGESADSRAERGLA